MPCRKSRQKNQSITDWEEEHKTHVEAWDRRRYHKDVERRVTNWDDYLGRHMRWYDDGQKHRLRLRPRWTAEDIAELERDDPDEQAYQTGINRVVSSNRRLILKYFIRNRD